MVISGDCTVSLGMVAGLQRKGVDPAIVWFDAHGDVQTLETTTSGYIGGMPLRLLVGYRPELIADRLGLRAWTSGGRCSSTRGTSIRQRSDYLRGSGSGGTGSRTSSFPKARWWCTSIWTSWTAPNCRALFPVPGGPSMRDVLAKVEAIIATGRVVAVDLACTWRPGNGAEARGFIQTVCKGFGKDPNNFRTQRDH